VNILISYETRLIQPTHSQHLQYATSSIFLNMLCSTLLGSATMA